MQSDIINDVVYVDAVPRDPNAYPCLSDFPPEARQLALSEQRPPGMRWALWTPVRMRRASAPSAGFRTVQDSTPEAIVAASMRSDLLTACVLVREDISGLETALQSVQDWTDHLLVVCAQHDERLQVQTREVARLYTPHILTAPSGLEADALRRWAADVAPQGWLFFLNAQERVPPRLPPVLRNLIASRGETFEALCLPVRHYFCGKWIEHSGWYPGYAHPQLVKASALRTETGAADRAPIRERTLYLPADDPELALLQDAYPNLTTYLSKLNQYTDAEAEKLLQEPGSTSWQAMLAHFVQDWQRSYNDGKGHLDGMHGFVLAFLSGFFRFTTQAKLWDRQREKGLLPPAHPLPARIEEMLTFMAQVAEQGAGQSVAPRPLSVPVASPSKPRALIIQCARGEHTRLLDLTEPSHAAYADRWDMDYVCRFGYHPADRTAGWDKIALVREMLATMPHELMIWLDADTCLVDYDRDLRDALPQDAWLGMVMCDPPHFNNGVMFVRNTDQSRAFFEAVWETFPIDHPWQDNAAVIQVLQQEPERWQGLARLGDIWNSTIHVNEVARPVIRAWHGYGTAEVRLGAMCDTLEALLQAEQRGEGGSIGRGGIAAMTGIGKIRQPPPRLPPAHPPLSRSIHSLDFRHALGRPLRVVWEGVLSDGSDLGRMNRAWCLGLLQEGDVKLCIREPDAPSQAGWEAEEARFAPLAACRNAPLSGPPDLILRCGAAPSWQRPESGKLVVMPIWEYGVLPQEWVDGARKQADAVWTGSRFGRDAWVRSGIPAEKLKIVPLGVDVETFTPQGAAFPLPTQKSLRLLFVGSVHHRDGADLLLKAWLRAASSRDDVCLVFLNQETDADPAHPALIAEIRRAQATEWMPEILSLNEPLSEHDRAALYRACTCLVYPYRNPHLPLAPLEAMSCGLPLIVTAGGPMDDYADDRNAIRLPYRMRVADPNPIGSLTSTGHPAEQEADLDALVEALRRVIQHPEEAQARGQQAAQRVQEYGSREQSLALLRERMADVVTPPHNTHVTPAVTKSALPQGESAGRSPGKRRRKSGRLSVCLLAQNAEAMLEASLRSIAPYAEELLVGVLGSTDRMREIAHSCGALVIDLAWQDSFAASRNAVLEHATSEWVFWMNPGEFLPPESGVALRTLLQETSEGMCAYRLPLHTTGPAEVDRLEETIRLFPNRPDLRYTYRACPQLLPALQRIGGQVRETEILVLKRPQEAVEDAPQHRRLPSFRLLERDLRDHPNAPAVLYQSGVAYAAQRELTLAAHYLHRSLTPPNPTAPYTLHAYTLLTEVLMELEDWEGALMTNKAGRAHSPQEPSLLLQAGKLYQQSHRFEEAREALETLTAEPCEGKTTGQARRIREVLGRHELALLYRRMGDAPACVRVLREVLTTVNQSAQVVNTYRYKPYGKQLSKTGVGTDPKFTWVGTQGYRQTGRSYSDVYVRARHYDTGTARWTTKDPIGLQAKDINVLMYGDCNPTTILDPSGLECLYPTNDTVCWSPKCTKANWRKPWDPAKDCKMTRKQLGWVKQICAWDKSNATGRFSPDPKVARLWYTAAPACCYIPIKGEETCKIYGCQSKWVQSLYDQLAEVYKVCLQENEERHFKCCRRTCYTDFKITEASNQFLHCVNSKLKLCGINVQECSPPRPRSEAYCDKPDAHDELPSGVK